MATRDTVSVNKSFSSKTEYGSIECKAEPIIHDFDEDALAAGPGAAIRDAIAKSIEGIAAEASPATVRRRRARGSTSTRLFNDTGALARGLRAEPMGNGEVAIAAPPDRLQDDKEHGDMLERLRELVPEIDNPLDDPEVDRAIEATLDDVIFRRR